MTETTGGPPEVPEWLHPLVTAVREEHLDGHRYGPPPDGSGRESAVLVAFRQTVAGPAVLLIQRAAQLRRHAGQVAFPGGAVDPGDLSHEAAALREANEEVGLDPASVRPVAELPALFIARSGFIVTPVLAWWHHPHPVSPVDVGEVAAVAVVPVAELVDPANRFQVHLPSGWTGPGFEVGGLFVWGFTAMLLDRLLSLAGWNRPWDETRRRPLPREVAGDRPVLP